MTRTVFVYLLSITFCIQILGQIDTSILIEEIEIEASSIRKNVVGGNEETWNTDQLNRSSASDLSTLLSSNNSAYIKNYGPGSLATSSIRGGNASQTRVLWNGLPVTSPMLGQLDLSLISIDMAEEVSIQKGGNSAMWGSGAIGGVINVENKESKNKGFSASNTLLYGAFGTVSEKVKVGVKAGNLSLTSKYSYREADNDFKYTPAPGLPKRAQTNAHFKQHHFMQDVYWRINPKNNVELHYWTTKSNRQIPPLITQKRSETYQVDLANRFNVNWKRLGATSLLYAKTGYFIEELEYYNPLNSITALSDFNTLMGDVTYEKNHGKKHKVLYGLSHFKTIASSPNYRERPIENRSAAILSHKYTASKFKLQTSLRQEIVSNRLSPLIPFVGLEYKVDSHSILKTKLTRNYRSPTLNDRFWSPGGNVDLKAESGWSQEVTIEHRRAVKSVELDFSLTGFNRIIDNWIQWSLQEGQSFYAAYNLTKVWSRGLEAKTSFDFNVRKAKFKIKGGYDLIRSTNEIQLLIPQLAKGEQLWYTPKYSGYSALNIIYKNMFYSLTNRMFGASNGINESIEKYSLVDMWLRYRLKVGDISTEFFINGNNIFNQDYVVVERRAMPGRHFQCGITINLK